MLEPLLILSNQILSQKLPVYKRFLFDRLNSDERMIALLGARGAGKTTLLLQYLKEKVAKKRKLYVIADHPLVLQHGLFNIADKFQQSGGEILVIDEIHKIKNFEIDLKLIYDSFFTLQVLFIGSSAVAINNAKADLSRRAVIHKLPILSFREFLEFETGSLFESYKVDDIIANHTQMAMDIISKIKPLSFFDTYLSSGAYPFYFDNKNSYMQKLLASSMQVLDSDLPAIYNIEYNKIQALKKMMSMLCQSEPYNINISKLCGAVELNQRTLYKYLGILQAAGLIRILGAKSNGISIISKPEKLYLDNSNLFSIFCTIPKKGTIRETFFASMLSYKHTINYPKQGDFIVDEKLIFEIGGKEKDIKQIKNLNNAYIVADDIEIGTDGKIPLWLFGFLY